MANKIKFGFRNVHYAKVTAETSSSVTYDTPKAILGGVNVSLSPKGDSTEFYADDVLFFNTTANQGYEGSIELADLSDDFKKDILGWAVDKNGALLESSDVLPATFALGFEVQGNEYPTRTWYYYCTVARPNEDASTKESQIEAQTRTLDITVSPRPTDEAVKISYTKTSDSDTVYNDFFTSVYEAQEA